MGEAPYYSAVSIAAVSRAACSESFCGRVAATKNQGVGWHAPLGGAKHKQSNKHHVREGHKTSKKVKP